jgi:hypothetical protein
MMKKIYLLNKNMDVKNVFNSLSIQAKISFFIYLIGCIITILLLSTGTIKSSTGIYYMAFFGMQSLIATYALNCLDKGNCDTFAYVLNFMHGFNVIAILSILVFVGKKNVSKLTSSSSSRVSLPSSSSSLKK